MTDSEAQEGNTLTLLGLTSSTDMKWSEYIKANAPSALRNIGSQWCAQNFSRLNQSCTSINLPFVYILNILAISCLVLLMCISRLYTNSRKGYAIQMILI